jgi:hypothetical protein
MSSYAIVQPQIQAGRIKAADRQRQDAGARGAGPARPRARAAIRRSRWEGLVGLFG